MAAGCAVVATAAVLAACGGGGSGEAQVASLSGKGSSGPPTSASGTGAEHKGSRPQIRLDSDHEWVAKIMERYNNCLSAHGADMDPDGGITVKRSAQKACRDKAPLYPPQMDASTNPHYLDDYHQWVTCMRNRGMRIRVLKPFGSGFSYLPSPSLTPSERDRVEDECQLKAFGTIEELRKEKRDSQ